MNFFKNSALLIGLVALSGCSVFSSFNEVKALNEAQAVGSTFTQALSAEYKEFANIELKDKFDYPDALHFARKGLSAASGADVLPEAIDDWNLREQYVRELGASRGRLILAFDKGAREAAPAVAARAQAKFDCWIEAQEETWSGDAEVGCKNEFMEAMADLESRLPPEDLVAATEAAPVAEELAFDVNPNEPMAFEDAVYLVFFDWNSSKIGAGANNVLESVADEVRKNTPGVLNIIGHTDTSGSKTYNQRLAIKRASTIRDALVSLGVPANLITTDARGESDLLVETPDNVREPANRRANISFN